MHRTCGRPRPFFTIKPEHNRTFVTETYWHRSVTWRYQYFVTCVFMKHRLGCYFLMSSDYSSGAFCQSMCHRGMHHHDRAEMLPLVPFTTLQTARPLSLPPITVSFAVLSFFSGSRTHKTWGHCVCADISWFLLCLGRREEDKEGKKSPDRESKVIHLKL